MIRNARYKWDYRLSHNREWNTKKYSASASHIQRGRSITRIIITRSAAFTYAPLIACGGVEQVLVHHGKRVKQNADWYNASLPIIQPVLEEKRKALLRLKARPTRQARTAHRIARANAQRVVRDCAHQYWDSICLDIQTARDHGDTRGMYPGIKRATGPTTQSSGILKQKDGTVIKDKSNKLNHWIEHYSELYTGQSWVSSDTIASLPNAPPKIDLDIKTDLEEVTAAIKRMPLVKLLVQMPFLQNFWKLALNP